MAAKRLKPTAGTTPPIPTIPAPAIPSLTPVAPTTTTTTVAPQPSQNKTVERVPSNKKSAQTRLGTVSFEKLPGDPASLTKTYLKSAGSLVLNAPVGALNFFVGAGIDIGKSALELGSKAIPGVDFETGKMQTLEQLKESVKETGKFLTQPVVGASKIAAPIGTLTPASYQRLSTNKAEAGLPERYVTALEANQSILPFLIEDFGNISMAGSLYSGIAKGAVRGVTLGEAAVRSERSAAASIFDDATATAAQKTAAAERIAVADAKLAKINRTKNFLTENMKLGKDLERLANKVGATPFKPYAYGTRKLLGVWRDGVYLGKDGRYARWGAKAAAGYKQQAEKLVDEGVPMDDPRVVDLINKSTKAGSRATSREVMQQVKEAKRDSENESGSAVRALYNQMKEPLHKEAINPETGEAFGDLTPDEAAAILAIQGGNAQIINRIALNWKLPPKVLALLGRYDFFEEFSLSERAAQLSYDFLNYSPETPGRMSIEQYERLAFAAENVSKAVFKSMIERAVAGYGRRNPLPAEQLVPTPFVEKLERNIVESINRAEKALKRERSKKVIDRAEITRLNLVLADRVNVLESWKAVKESGILELPVDSPDRIAVLKGFVDQLPIELALDPTMYSAAMRVPLEFYKRIRRGMAAAILGDEGGTEVMPDGDGGGPRLSPTRAAKEGAVEAELSKRKKKVKQIESKITRIVEVIDKKEAQHAKLVERIARYDIVDEFIAGKSIEQIAKDNSLSLDLVKEIISNSAPAKTYIRAQKIKEEMDALRASFTDEQFAEYPELAEQLRVLEEQAALAKAEYDNISRLAEEERQQIESETEGLTDELDVLEDEMEAYEDVYEREGGVVEDLWERDETIDYEEKIDNLIEESYETAKDSFPETIPKSTELNWQFVPVVLESSVDPKTGNKYEVSVTGYYDNKPDPKKFTLQRVDSVDISAVLPFQNTFDKSNTIEIHLRKDDSFDIQEDLLNELQYFRETLQGRPQDLGRVFRHFIGNSFIPIRIPRLDENLSIDQIETVLQALDSVENKFREYLGIPPIAPSISPRTGYKPPVYTDTAVKIVFENLLEAGPTIGNVRIKYDKGDDYWATLQIADNKKFDNYIDFAFTAGEKVDLSREEFIQEVNEAIAGMRKGHSDILAGKNDTYSTGTRGVFIHVWISTKSVKGYSKLDFEEFVSTVQAVADQIAAELPSKKPSTAALRPVTPTPTAAVEATPAVSPAKAAFNAVVTSKKIGPVYLSAYDYDDSGVTAASLWLESDGSEGGVLIYANENTTKYFDSVDNFKQFIEDIKTELLNAYNNVKSSSSPGGWSAIKKPLYLPGSKIELATVEFIKDVNSFDSLDVQALFDAIDQLGSEIVANFPKPSGPRLSSVIDDAEIERILAMGKEKVDIGAEPSRPALQPAQPSGAQEFTIESAQSVLDEVFRELGVTDPAVIKMVQKHLAPDVTVVDPKNTPKKQLSHIKAAIKSGKNFFVVIQDNIVYFSDGYVLFELDKPSVREIMALTDGPGIYQNKGPRNKSPSRENILKVNDESAAESMLPTLKTTPDIKPLEFLYNYIDESVYFDPNSGQTVIFAKDIVELFGPEPKLFLTLRNGKPAATKVIYKNLTAVDNALIMPKRGSNYGLEATPPTPMERLENIGSALRTEKIGKTASFDLKRIAERINSKIFDIEQAAPIAAPEAAPALRPISTTPQRVLDLLEEEQQLKDRVDELARLEEEMGDAYDDELEIVSNRLDEIDVELRNNYGELDVVKNRDSLKPPAGKPARLPVAADGRNAKSDYVVIPCGNEKSPTAARVADFYVGSMFKDALATARQLFTDDRIFVMSAKHGLVTLDTVLEPYDLKMGDPGSVTPDEISRQVSELSGLPSATVMSLLPKEYHNVFVRGADRPPRRQWTITQEFAGTKGIGEQKGRLKQLRQESPAAPIEPKPKATKPSEVTPDPVIKNPVVREAVYTTEMVDAMAAEVAAKMDAAQTVRERLKAFQEWLDASKKYDAEVARMNIELDPSKNARSKKLEVEAKIAELRAALGELPATLASVEASVARITDSPYYEPYMAMTGGLPLDVALGGGFPSDIGGFEVPGAEGADGVRLIGPMYYPSGVPRKFYGGIEREVTRPGFQGYKKLGSEHYRDGDRHVIFSLRQVALRMGREVKQMIMNERYRAIVTSFGSKASEILGEEFAQKLYEQSVAWADNMPQDALYVRFRQMMAESLGQEMPISGIASPGPGVVGQKAVREWAINFRFGELIGDAMRERGFEAVDPYADIERAISAQNIKAKKTSDVPDTPDDATGLTPDDIVQETIFLPKGLKEQMLEVIVPSNPGKFQKFLTGAQKVTSFFKAGTLVLSIPWQVGDLTSSMIISTMSGVDPRVLIGYMKQIAQEEYGTGRKGLRRMVDPFIDDTGKSKLTPRRLFDSEATTDVGQFRRGPFARLAGESGVQNLGASMQERAYLYGEDLKPERGVVDRLTGGRLKVVSDIAAGVTGVSFKINETINKISRHAFFLEKLDAQLRQRGQSLESIRNVDNWQNDAELKKAVFDAARSANEWLGDYANLTVTERKYFTPIFPFWAWIRHIHGVFDLLAVNNPESLFYYMYLGTLASSEEEDPLNLRRGGFNVFGGVASSNFINPFADVFYGPVGGALLDQDLRPFGSTLGPVPRLAGGAVGLDLARWNVLKRPAGTGGYSETGEQTSRSFLPFVGGSVSETLGFTAQQFPIVQRLLNLNPTPFENIPGTRVALGPVARYQTGEARLSPETGQRIVQPGGRGASLLRVFGGPLVPYRSDQQINDVLLAARQKLLTLDELQRLRELQGAP